MGTITDPPYDVYSKTNSNESFYKHASGQWLDFFNYDAYNNFQTEWNDNSWNLPSPAIRLFPETPVMGILMATEMWMA